MKFLRLALVAVVCWSSTVFAQQQFTGPEAARLCPQSKMVLINKQSRVPSFIVFGRESNIPAAAVIDHLRPVLKLGASDELRLSRTENDQLGFTHHRYQQYFAGVFVKGGEYLVHERNGRVESVNGMWFDGLNLSTAAALSEAQALQKALAHIGASVYKWQVPAEEAQIKLVQRNASATHFPKGELMIAPAKGDVFKKDLRLCWKFDVYASEPMSRQYIYVDAQSGEIIHSENRIHEIDTPGSANTMYSGTQNIVCDNFNAGQFRLRETGRGQGIETYNLQNGTNQGNAVDFINNSSTWTSTTNDDHAAYDAHWGAEMTYDYYMNAHGRDGLDGNGMLMVSYVHYGNNYNNAFWDGQSMTYGDGSQQSGGFNPLTGIDVVGHEFTHGVTEHSANLDYQDESGALNESFSDIFGTTIEFINKPLSADYLIGEEIVVNVGSALRSMSNPNQFGDPDCYTGTNWYTGTADNGGVHTNSGVQNFWFYLLSNGGAGTNDLGDAYAITGIGITDAASIAYRNLTFYLVSTSQYADARTYAIQSAQDIFGACTPEVIATTNAWFACGVGPAFSAAVNAAFTADLTSSCSVPVTVNFSNNSTNATNAWWNFGDNTTGTQYNASHTYTQPGTYNVQLVVNSACGSDSVLQSSYIVVNTPPAPSVTGASSCTPASMTLNASGTGTLEWFTQASGGSSFHTGTSYTTPVLSSTVTYYVESQVPQAPGNVGPTTYNFGGGGMHNNTSTQYLEFTVLQPCTLATALVNAGASGNRTFTLWDNQGNQVNQVTVNVPSGVQTITLNLPLTPGQYRIGGTQMNLYRNNSGPNYPYSLNGVINITGSSAGGGYYYYLYNWGVTLSPCTGPRVPVTALIGLSGVTYTAASYDTVCANTTAPFTLSGGSPAGGSYSGPGVSGGMFDPAAAGQGTHTITYTYTDVNNCTGTATQTIFADICTGVQDPAELSAMNVYPNPAQGQFTLELQMPSAQTVEVRALDLLGQEILAQRIELGAGTTRMDVNAAGWAKGIYLVQLRTATGTRAQRIVIQ